MTEHDHSKSAALEALIAQLPSQVPPPAGCWDRIQRAIERQDAVIEHRSASLPQAVEPPDGVWQRVLSDIGGAERLGAQSRLGSRALMPLTAPFGLAALLAIVIVFAGLAPRLGISPPIRPEIVPLAATPSDLGWPSELLDRAPGRMYPSADPYLAQLTASIRQDFQTVRAERLAIERSLQQGPDSTALRRLWAHTYHTELMLVDQASKLLEQLDEGEDI